MFTSTASILMHMQIPCYYYATFKEAQKSPSHKHLPKINLLWKQLSSLRLESAAFIGMSYFHYLWRALFADATGGDLDKILQLVNVLQVVRGTNS